MRAASVDRIRQAAVFKRRWLILRGTPTADVSLDGAKAPTAPPARNTGEFPMEVILKEDVANLGHRGDVVKVADGYGRNFLLPRKLALQATLANKAVIETMKTAAVRRSASEKVQAEELVSKLEPLVLSFTRKSGEAGHLFGSVTSADIASDLAAKGFELDRRKIQLDEPLKSLGEFSVAIKLHREVIAHVRVKVLAEAGSEAAAAEPAAEAVATE
jgi:large subunit ribosomal protein L9